LAALFSRLGRAACRDDGPDGSLKIFSSPVLTTFLPRLPESEAQMAYLEGHGGPLQEKTTLSGNVHPEPKSNFSTSR